MTKPSLKMRYWHIRQALSGTSTNSSHEQYVSVRRSMQLSSHTLPGKTWEKLNVSVGQQESIRGRKKNSHFFRPKIFFWSKKSRIFFGRKPTQNTSDIIETISDSIGGRFSDFFKNPWFPVCGAPWPVTKIDFRILAKRIRKTVQETF